MKRPMNLPMNLGGSLLLVGCGKMGGALLDGWLARGLEAGSVTVVEPFAAGAEAVAAKGIRVVGDAAQLPAGFAPVVAVLAIKPQQMEAALPAYRGMIYEEIKKFIAEAKNTIPDVQATIVTHQKGVDEDQCADIIEQQFGVKYRPRRYNIVG